MKLFLLLTTICAVCLHGNTQAQQAMKPEDTEIWQPVPARVSPGAYTPAPPPSDAIVLFDGKHLDEWVSNKDHQSPAGWLVKDGMVTVNKAAGRHEAIAAFFWLRWARAILVMNCRYWILMTTVLM